MPNPSAKLLAALALAAALAAAGCAGDKPKPTRANPGLQVTESGFLRDYSRLKPSPRHPGTRYQQSSTLSSYTGFIVDPVQVLPGETSRGDAIDGAQAAGLSDGLRRELSDALRLKGRLANAPGPGIARIRAGITGVAQSDRTGAVSSVPTIGGASIEADIVDSLTGKRIGAVVDSEIVQDSDLNGNGGSRDPFSDARLVFRHWAARLNLWLDDADELATE